MLIAATIFTAAAILAISAFIFVSPCLVLSDGKGNEFAAIPFKGEKEFAISFIHSVNKSEVEEGYYIDNEEIMLDYCLYAGFGAGVATQPPPGGSLRMLDNGRMLVSGFDQEMGRLSYIVGTVSDHILHINGEKLSLTELCGRNSRVLFTYSKRLIFD